uniref:RZ-type domain-containing protein n=1 Tax=Timema monikensis TaxID=170555 RepID=A0A7R9EF00_9NEOP|nr:unnamed protein product [Timema monikensis]
MMTLSSLMTASARFVYLEDCHHVVEAQGLETWLGQSDGEIAMKVCPRCKTTIARTQRYLDLVKKHYRDVAKVKLRVFGKMKELESKRRDLASRLDKLSHNLCITRASISLVTSSSFYTKFMKQIQKSLELLSKNKRDNLSSYDAETLGIQIQILEQLEDAFVSAAKVSNDSGKKKMINLVDQLIQVIIIRDDYLSQQEVKEINIELKRFHRLSQMSIIESSYAFQTTINQHGKMQDYEEATKMLDSIEKYTGDKDDRVNQIIKDLQSILRNSLEFHENERKEIVKAMGLKQGHWFKCPNGHVYVITECGGAMEVGKCNECGAAINTGCWIPTIWRVRWTMQLMQPGQILPTWRTMLWVQNKMQFVLNKNFQLTTRFLLFAAVGYPRAFDRLNRSESIKRTLFLS